MPSARRSRSKLVEAPRTQIGDYFAHAGLDGPGVRLKTGPLDDKFFTLLDEHVTRCATLEGAQRLAALMNEARDLARDYRLVCDVEGPHGTRDQIASYIASHVANALDTPHRWIDPEEHTRLTLREYGHDVGDLARFFAFLDSKGAPATLESFKARALLRKHSIEDRSVSYCNHGRAREIERAWRRSFDASIPAEKRAAKVHADLAAKEAA